MTARIAAALLVIAAIYGAFFAGLAWVGLSPDVVLVLAAVGFLLEWDLGRWLLPHGLVTPRLGPALIREAGVVAGMVYLGWRLDEVGGLWFVLACVGACWLCVVTVLEVGIGPSRLERAHRRNPPAVIAYLEPIADRLALLSGAQAPQLVPLTKLQAADALAFGDHRAVGAIGLTDGLLAMKLSAEEWEALLAHELIHLLHRDSTVMVLANSWAALSGWLLHHLMLNPAGAGNKAAAARDVMVDFVLMPVFAACAILLLLSFLPLRALARYREYAADDGAARLTGNPAALASALLKVSRKLSDSGPQDLRELAAAEALMFCPAPCASQHWFDHFAELLSTHPSVEHRVARLEIVAALMSSAVSRC